MAAIAAHVFHESAAARDVLNPVAAHDADGRVRDVSDVTLGLEKRVAAVARELAIAVAIADGVHVVPEEPAEVSDFLVEDGRFAIRVCVHAKQQRMTALHADIFSMVVALDQFFVSVMAKETRQRVPDVRERPVLAEIPGAAAAPPLA